MKRGNSAPSRVGLFYRNHFGLAHCSDLQAAFIYWTTSYCRWFLLAKVGHSSPDSLPCLGPILHFSLDCSALQAACVCEIKRSRFVSA